MRSRALIGLLLSSCALTGCASFAGSAVSDASSVVGLVSTATTGKGLGDHLLSALTGEDCNLSEGLLREDRAVCEAEGSPATLKDFKGLYAEARKRGGGAYLSPQLTVDGAEYNNNPHVVWSAMRQADAKKLAAEAEVKAAELVDSGPQTEGMNGAVSDGTAMGSATAGSAIPDVQVRMIDQPITIAPGDSAALGLTFVQSPAPAPKPKPTKAAVAVERAKRDLKRDEQEPSPPAWNGEGGPLLLIAAEATSRDVTYRLESGHPVATIRLAPMRQAGQPARLDEVIATVPPSSPIPTDETLAPQAATPLDAVAAPQPAARVDTPALPPAEVTEAIDPATLLPTGDPILNDPAAAPGNEAANPVPRYTAVRPRAKPDIENGVGGALDLGPPAVQPSDQPRPMRLNNVTTRSKSARAAKARTRDVAPTETARRGSRSNKATASNASSRTAPSPVSASDPLDLPASASAVAAPQSAEAAASGAPRVLDFGGTAPVKPSAPTSSERSLADEKPPSGSSPGIEP